MLRPSTFGLQAQLDLRVENAHDLHAFMARYFLMNARRSLCLLAGARHPHIMLFNFFRQAAIYYSNANYYSIASYYLQSRINSHKIYMDLNTTYLST